MRTVELSNCEQFPCAQIAFSPFNVIQKRVLPSRLETFALEETRLCLPLSEIKIMSWSAL